MNLIEKWRSRETKKKLREENIRLKQRVSALQMFPREIVQERNVQEIRGCHAVPRDKADMPVEYIKRELINGLIEYVKPFVEYDVRDSEMGGKVYIAKLYVATGGKYEH